MNDFAKDQDSGDARSTFVTMIEWAAIAWAAAHASNCRSARDDRTGHLPGHSCRDRFVDAAELDCARERTEVLSVNGGEILTDFAI